MASNKIPSGARLASSLRFDGVTRFSETSWTPNTDIFLDEESLVIQVEVAGIQREDLRLRADGNRLWVTGSRSPERLNRPPRCKFIVMEIHLGDFRFYIDLPNGYDLSRADAKYHNGVLRVEVPIAGRSHSEEGKK